MNKLWSTIFITALLGFALARQNNPSPSRPSPPQAESTRKMAEVLRQIASQSDPLLNPFQSSRRVMALRQKMEVATDEESRLATLFILSTELLNAGQPMESLQSLQNFETAVRALSSELYEKNLPNLRINQALCWMRIGEITNCLADHNSESCLAPLAGRGIHRHQEGSRKALKILDDLLQTQQTNLMARWLYNIASMTVGDYPAKVPSAWLVPPSAFASEYEIKRFKEVAPAVGLGVRELSGGSVLEDFDGDGDLDVMCSSIGFQDQLRYFRNNGDGTFTDQSREAGLEGLTGGLNLIQGDYNNDGAMDVLVLRGAWMKTEGRYPKSLLRNNGQGWFEDVSEAAGLISRQPSQTAVWFDYDNDGWIDLFIGNESTGNDGHVCQLFRNDRRGGFVECAREAGLNLSAYVKGTAFADYNNDGRPDLYLSVLGDRNQLFRNDGPQSTNAAGKVFWKFTEVGRRTGVSQPLFSFPCWFFDYNNDGWEDLLVTGYRIKDVGDICADYLGLPHQAERARLFRNKGDGNFEDVTVAAGLNRVLHAMGSNYGDLDNDGFLDFYLGTGDPDLGTIIPNRMFRNDGGRRFQDVTTSGGFGHLQKGHGVSFGDLDNDGDQDVFEDMGGAVSSDVAHNVVYQNPGHGNHWLTLKLVGKTSNRAAIGARIRVDLETPAGKQSVYKTVRSGGSFGASPLRQEIGLGAARAIRGVEIMWPGSTNFQRVNGISMDRFFQITEGEAKGLELKIKSFQLKSEVAGGHQHHHE